MGIQVSTLTKNKQPWQTEYIDFEFAGKKISEFGMVAVSNGDRLSFQHSPTFTDETSTVNAVDGQYFWGTTLKTIRRSFNLSTDGMTEQQWNSFKLHFAPGKYGKFIEDHLFHRYGYCRVVEVAELKVVPFQEKQLVLGQLIDGNIYKGECSITFEWDTPFYYATENILTDSLNSDNKESYLRAIYNNGTPLASSWNNLTQKCFVGDSQYTLLDGGLYQNIYHTDEASDLIFYNPSIAPARPIITLNFKPSFTNSSPTVEAPTYFNEIADDINGAGGTKPYNIIATTKSCSLELNKDKRVYPHQFYYSTPNLIYSVNRAIQIAAEFYKATAGVGQTTKLEETLRLEIVNNEVIAWAAAALRIILTKNANYGEAGTYQDGKGNFTTNTLSIPTTCIGGIGAIEANWFQYFNIFMLCIIGACSDNSRYHLEDDNWLNFPNYTIIFDTSLSQSKMIGSYNQIESANGLTKIAIEEKFCGDMVHSSYLKLDGGDSIDLSSGLISTCHYMTFKKGDNSSTPERVSLQYDYIYV